MKHETSGKESYEHQVDLVLNQAAPISGTMYEVLPVTSKVRIIALEADVTWTVQPTPLQIHVITDGVTVIYTIANPASGTFYQARHRVYAVEATQALAAIVTDDLQCFLLEGKSIQVLAETTGGTVSNLSCRVKYALLRP